MTAGRERSFVIPWVLGLVVCGGAAALTLAIDRAGPTTEVRLGAGRAVATADSAAAPRQLATSDTTAAAAAPVASTPVDSSTPRSLATVPGTGEVALSGRTATGAGSAGSPATPATARGAAPQREVATATTGPRQPAAPGRTTDAPVVRSVPRSNRRYSARPGSAAHYRQRLASAGRSTDRPRTDSLGSARRVAAGAVAPIDTIALPAAARAAVVDSVAAVLARAIADSAFPGAYAVVGTHAGVIAGRGVGHLDWAASPVPDGRTIWDLASLTKVIGTTTAVMQLVERGRVDLDAPVQRYLPQWTGAHKSEVLVRHLLSHSSGLRSGRPYYREATTSAALLARVYAEPLDTTPGVRMVYSDIGAILLGQIVERVSGQTLDRYLAGHVFKPLGMTGSGYRPDSSLLPRIAPTERDPWRGRLVRGEVHDENASVLGGVSGHAGLFSTGDDLARFARMYLNGGTLDGTRVLRPETIQRFTAIQDSALSNRALGWEKPNGSNSAGHRMSPDAFGHTGFTGTSFWVDPRRDVFVVLLTNRVNPTRENMKISGVRRAIADGVLGALGVPAPAPATP